MTSVNSIAATYRASFLSYQASPVIAFVLSWLATLSCTPPSLYFTVSCYLITVRLAAIGRFMFPRHPSIKFEAAKKFVEENEPLDVDGETDEEDLEMRAVPRPLPELPQLPEAAHSKDSL